MKKMMFAFVAIVLVIVLAGGGAFYYFVLRNQDTGETEEIRYTYALEDYFVTNVRDSDKLFKITVVLVMNENPEDQEIASTLESNLYLIRDRINVLLRTKTETDLTASNIEDTLRQEISSTVNEALGVDYVVSAYFTDFVMQ